ncbi:hypothetical protein U1872_13885 [Sphingomonas sp. RB3P16]|uniref:hypothetical protein n=1 Tax=Parasphingomonas frigoris TaxID=3096163 RepID=UPI002FC7F095
MLFFPGVGVAVSLGVWVDIVESAGVVVDGSAVVVVVAGSDVIGVVDGCVVDGLVIDGLDVVGALGDAGVVCAKAAVDSVMAVMAVRVAIRIGSSPFGS